MLFNQWVFFLSTATYCLNIVLHFWHRRNYNFYWNNTPKYGFGWCILYFSNIHSFIHSIGMCRMRRFLAVLRNLFHSSLLYAFASTLFHQLVFHPLSHHLATYFLVYLATFSNQITKCVSHFSRSFIKYSEYYTSLWHFLWGKSTPPDFWRRSF